MTRGLVWLRNDLRVRDNPALTKACQDHDEVVVFYIATPKTWKSHNKAAVQVEWILRNLQVLSVELSKLNIAFLFGQVGTFKQSVSSLVKLVEEKKIDAVYFNQQCEVDERERDARFKNKVKVPVYDFMDQAFVDPSFILNKSGEPYKVFTPFKKAWLAYADAQLSAECLPRPKKRKAMFLKPTLIPNELSGFENKLVDLKLKPGESAAIVRLKKFLETKIVDYDKLRDFPGYDNTSFLSPYLAIGVLSVRECLYYLLLNEGQERFSHIVRAGALTWMSELIWREFYRYILFHFPRVCRNKPFKLITDRLPWKTDVELLKAWQQGETGFPLVDAAMRQLNQTGWMHNRLRMVVAMFFTKTLFLDWRLGEAYFMRHLIDGDFASNNGGWQWSASTGTDSAPYFRIFNPLSQSERFDPKGEFIRKYCPELKYLDAKTIHAPFSCGAVDLNYPEPIVDYAAMRRYVIDGFKKL